MGSSVIVVGLGAMGSATAYALAKRGVHVVGIDRYSPPHAHGSSHGHSRMIREAYAEHPMYVPLVRRAYQLWEEFERESGGKTFLRKTGGLWIGSRDGPLVNGAIASAMQYRIPHEILGAAKLHRRFPAFAPLDEWVGVHELRAGCLAVEPILTAFHEGARKHGAELHVGEGVRAVGVTPGGGVLVTTDRGAYEGDQLVLAVGAWLPALLPDESLPLTIERQVSYWFEPARDTPHFAPDRMPVTLWELGGGKTFFTMPDFGDGVKVGLHHGGEPTSADAVRRPATPEEDAAMYDLLRRFAPLAKGHPLGTSVCLYTNTPDGHFIIDRLPRQQQTVVLSACSGHGFKFAIVLGELVADLLQGRAPAFDLGPFALSRFAA